MWFSGVGEVVGVRDGDGMGDGMIRNLHSKHFCKKKKKKKRFLNPKMTPRYL